jgi:hypothetical protein
MVVIAVLKTYDAIAGANNDMTIVRSVLDDVIILKSISQTIFCLLV